MTWRMPAEWEPQARLWMAWPCHEPTYQGPAMAGAQQAYAAVARAAAGFEPVTMVARPEDAAEAARACGAGVEILPLPLDDSWTRDTGPSFVTGPGGRLGGVDWRHTAWGGFHSDVSHDAELARRICGHSGAEWLSSPLGMEGGAVHVDGEGTLLTSESVVLNPSRNPCLTKRAGEAEFGRLLGAERVVWLGDGLTGDGTDGHVDNFACFVRPGLVLLHDQPDPADPDHAIMADAAHRLRAARDARGRPLEIVRIPAPAAIREDGHRLTASYVNFTIVNGGILMPAFGVPEDKEARGIVARLFPGRRVVQLPARAIVRGGGGIHCITQQQPKAPA